MAEAKKLQKANKDTDKHVQAIANAASGPAMIGRPVAQIMQEHPEMKTDSASVPVFVQVD